jgi:hypothetical protein
MAPSVGRPTHNTCDTGGRHPKGFDDAQCIGRRVRHCRGLVCGRSGLRRPCPRPAHAQHASRLLPRGWSGLADFSRLLRRRAISRWLVLACDSVRGADDRPPVWACLAWPSVCCAGWSGPGAGASRWVWWGRTTATTTVKGPPSTTISSSVSGTFGFHGFDVAPLIAASMIRGRPISWSGC